MKKVLVALVCTLGAVGCGESRPAEDPSSTRTTKVVTTETTTTSAARPARANTATAAADANANRSGKSAPADGYDTTRPSKSDADYGTFNANGAAATAPIVGSVNAGPTTGGASNDNPGVAHNTKDADNTKVNERDRHGALTPMDQGGGKDRDITAAIRRAVVSDGALSFTAKNVKIITNGGKVTLRGPVKSEAEKSTIEAKAKSTAGVAEVDNQLEVKK